MADRRDTPNPEFFQGARAAAVARPAIDLLATPGGARDRQLLFGDPVTVLGETGDHLYLRSDKDGYHGFAHCEGVGPARAATHRVSARATQVYAAPDIKSPDVLTLSFGSRLVATATHDRFVETPEGFVPIQHVAPIDRIDCDPAAIALLFLGAPYLWGGNTQDGIDCSGLVQAALLACGVSCPGDSDQQMHALGTPLAPGSAAQRGDLLFWKGHVAMYVAPDSLVHANAHHMSTVVEPAADTIERISAQGGGPVIAHLRPALPGV